MRTLLGLLLLVAGTVSAKETLIVSTDHCAVVSLLTKQAAELRDKGQPLELTLAQVVYTRTITPPHTVAYYALPFVYQWTPVVYHANWWTPEKIYQDTVLTCSTFLGKRLVIPPME